MRKDFIENNSFMQYKKECINRYMNGCSIKRISPKMSEYLRIIFGKKTEIPFFDLNVNNVCTLKCRNCDQGMPYFNNKTIFSAEEIIANMEQLLEKVDYVYQISILGGEPFINRDLDKVLKYCVDSEKIGSIIVVTNGTLFPSLDVLNLLKHDKIIVGVSWYPLKDDTNREKLLQYFERCNINYHVRKDDWLDFGDFRINRNYSKVIIKKCYRKCFLNKCVQYNNGILYRCTKVHLLKDQNIQMPRKNEFIDVNSIKNKRKMRRKLAKFYSVKYLSACNYCNSSEQLVSIPLGEQLD